VEGARDRQRDRFQKSEFVSNGEMGPGDVRVHCPLDDSGTALVRQAMNQLHLSARAFHRVLKLARTIADFAGDEGIGTPHLAEALQYRPRRWG
jgi:magnesium chelatase family protein